MMPSRRWLKPAATYAELLQPASIATPPKPGLAKGVQAGLGMLRNAPQVPTTAAGLQQHRLAEQQAIDLVHARARFLLHFKHRDARAWQEALSSVTWGCQRGPVPKEQHGPARLAPSKSLHGAQLLTCLF